MMNDNDDIFELFLAVMGQLETEDQEEHKHILHEDLSNADKGLVTQKTTQKER